MIHLCTFATLMFLQNNISQKILFIAARTIEFPGFVFKVCIDLIVAIVTSSIYFDVQKFPYLFKNIYISNLLGVGRGNLTKHIRSFRIYEFHIGTDSASLSWARLLAAV